MGFFKGRIYINSFDVNLKMILEGGQCFRWKGVGPGHWLGTFHDAVWNLKQSDDYIDYDVITSEIQDKSYVNIESGPDFRKLLQDYLRLEEPLRKYYQDWSEKDEFIKKSAKLCYGIRILKQDPVENLFSFICSSNNNIARISSMVEKLCSMYGKKIVDIEGKIFYSFPPVSRLAVFGVEDDLRKAGFGYRAKFIQKAAGQLLELGGKEWLEKQKKVQYKEAKTNLMMLSGIGAKVADCICLMSLGHLEAVPIDTHVFQIASQHYLPHLKSVKNVTDRIYNEIGDFFRDLYGPLAGWAHTVLFCNDLKMFRPELELNKSKIGLKRKTTKDNERQLESNSGKLVVPINDLNLKITFNCGQAYRWKEVDENIWQGVLEGRVWTLKQSDEYIHYTASSFAKQPKANKKTNKLKVEENKEFIKKNCEQILKDYFRLDEPLQDFYREWSKRDPHFNDVANTISGLRMTKQNIVENLFAFVCSTNNTISRTAKMIENLCVFYGREIAQINDISFYDFPEVTSLCSPDVEDKLRKANFGFRAKYVHECGKYITKNGGNEWFSNLLKLPYKEAKQELMKLPGIGAKVADCICLTALGHLNTIPVDTHVFSIAKKYYLTHLKERKSVSASSYEEIGDYFRKMFGHYAGWAHTVLFCSDLKMHSSLLSKTTEKSK